MRIAIVSDIHDNVWTLQAALTSLHNADILICCGDLCSPFIVSLMAEGFSGPIHIVEGNNEGDWRRITQQAAKYSHVHLYGEFFQEEIDGKRQAVAGVLVIEQQPATADDHFLHWRQQIATAYNHHNPKPRCYGTTRLAIHAAKPHLFRGYES